MTNHIRSTMQTEQNDQLSYNMTALFKALVTVTEGEEQRKAIGAIRSKAGSPFPQTLRQALGRSLMECNAQKEGQEDWENFADDDVDIRVVDYRLRHFADEVPIQGKGTPGKAQPKHHLRAPWKTDKILQRQMSTRKKVVRMSIKRVQKGVTKVLGKSRQVALTNLFSQLVTVVRAKRLLLGFSSAAVIGGCLCFAAEVLDKELPLFRPFFRAHLERVGLVIGRYATRAAYNALWHERHELEAVVAELSCQVDDLTPPKVAMKWEVHLDMESRAGQ